MPTVQALKSTLLVLTLSAVVGACAGAPKQRDGRGRKAKPRQTVNETKRRKSLSPAEREFLAIQDLYLKKEFSDAQTRLKSFKSRFRRSSKIANAYNLDGLIFLSYRKYLQAIHQFKTAIKVNRDPEFGQHVLYNLASTQFEAGQVNESTKTLGRIEPGSLNPFSRLKFFYLKSRIAFRRRQRLESARYAMRAGSLLDQAKSEVVDTSRVRELLSNQLDQALEKVEDQPTLEQIYSQFNNNPLDDIILFKMASLSLKASQVDQAEPRLKLLIERYPESIKYEKAVDMLRSLRNRGIVSQRTVGVLVPMTGRFAKFGRQSLHGIELAFQIFNPKAPDSRVELVIEDSGETAESAVAALNKLYFEHHVVAVIGPLLSRGIKEVTERAEDLGLPIISLAQQAGEPGNYVFQSAVTPRHQCYEIARHAVQNMGLRKFAILYPNDNFGKNYAQHFWDAVEEMGGQVTGYETYQPKETDFRQPVDKLTGLFYREARQRELDELEALRKELNITKRNRRTEKYFKLEPVVDFDAVFIPDEAKTVGQVLPTFAYRDVDDVAFLGVSTWNSQVLVGRTQGYADRAFFVDAFFPSSMQPAVQNFVSQYKSTYGQTPSSIEAMGFDAASLLERALLLDADGPSRGDLKEALARVKNHPGVTGKIYYENGAFLRDLKVLTISRSKIIEANGPQAANTQTGTFR